MVLSCLKERIEAILIPGYVKIRSFCCELPVCRCTLHVIYGLSSGWDYKIVVLLIFHFQHQLNETEEVYMLREGFKVLGDDCMLLIYSKFMYLTFNHLVEGTYLAWYCPLSIYSYI